MLKNRLLLFFFYLLLPSVFCLGQRIEKQKGTVKNEAFTYYAMQPDSDAKGVLILLPGMGEKPKSIFEKSDLPLLVVERGFLVLVPEINQSLFADQKAIDALNELLRLCHENYQVSDFVIGGFSSGGAIAIGYAEYLVSVDSASTLKGVFAIDSALDLARLHESASRKISYPCQGLIAKEGKSILEQLQGSLGGTPQTKSETYATYSSFVADDPSGGNANYLGSLPIRLYTEPDLDFVQKTYCPDLSVEDINAVDLQGLHRFLLSIGNSQAEYITTVGKGFHSWDILDASDGAEWIRSIFN